VRANRLGEILRKMFKLERPLAHPRRQPRRQVYTQRRSAPGPLSLN
jgi:hypothetical protein